MKIAARKRIAEDLIVTVESTVAVAALEALLTGTDAKTQR
jgi:hypothetical protein